MKRGPIANRDAGLYIVSDQRSILSGTPSDMAVESWRRGARSGLAPVPRAPGLRSELELGVLSGLGWLPEDGAHRLEARLDGVPVPRVCLGHAILLHLARIIVKSYW